MVFLSFVQPKFTCVDRNLKVCKVAVVPDSLSVKQKEKCNGNMKYVCGGVWGGLYRETILARRKEPPQLLPVSWP